MPREEYAAAIAAGLEALDDEHQAGWVDGYAAALNNGVRRRELADAVLPWAIVLFIFNIVYVFWKIVGYLT